jgi:hypothetical protein
MRIILIIPVILLFFSADLYAQNDFVTLDKRTYDLFIRGDYENLKKTADTIFSKGKDYYYLRLRLGILSFNKQLYSSSLEHFSKAAEFNPGDTVSGSYIYYSYLYSGRKADADLYLKSIPRGNKTRELKSINMSGISEIFTGFSASENDVYLYRINRFFYESIKNSLSISAGFESLFSGRFKGTFALTNYRKTGTVYSPTNYTGTGLNISQNQVYAKLAGYVFPGWEFSGFSHILFYTDTFSPAQTGAGSSTNKSKIEYLAGVGSSKNGWKIRTGASISLSNFSNSNQIRGEVYLTYLPLGNLNVYLTSGGMFQADKNWGPTYQVNQEAGFKITKFLWLETGIIYGNSFLYTRNEGYVVNNSFQIPTITIYENIIIVPGKKVSITATPFFARIETYSWNLNDYTKTNKLSFNSFGGTIKFVYKNK